MYQGPVLSPSAYGDFVRKKKGVVRPEDEHGCNLIVLTKATYAGAALEALLEDAASIDIITSPETFKGHAAALKLSMLKPNASLRVMFQTVAPQDSGLIHPQFVGHAHTGRARFRVSTDRYCAPYMIVNGRHVWNDCGESAIVLFNEASRCAVVQSMFNARWDRAITAQGALVFSS